jgi:hypothetical protein
MVCVSVSRQQTEEFDEDDIDEELIKQLHQRGTTSGSRVALVVPLHELLGVSSEDNEKCVVVVLDGMSPRSIKYSDEELSADVRTMQNGRSAACLFAAQGRIVISEEIVREVRPMDYDRLVVLWVFNDEDARLCEYAFTDDVNFNFSNACDIARRINEARESTGGDSSVIVFDSFTKLDFTGS